MKICARCKDPSQQKFHKNKSNPDGFDIYCTKCRMEYIKNYKSTPKGQDVYRRSERNRGPKRIAKRKASGICINHASRNVVPNHFICQTCIWFAQERNLKHFFKLTLEDFAWMEYHQNRVCAMCKKKCASGRELSVDHDHKTGKVRGLLCGNCNRLLGKIEKLLLQTIITYLAPFA